ncbi:Vacuolar protein sorting-associated protein 8, partial [Perkinsus olseni]
MTASPAPTPSTPAAKPSTSLDYSSVELPIRTAVKGVRTGVSTFRFTCIAACQGPKVALGTQHGHTIVVSHELGAQRVRTIRPPAEDAGSARSVDWSADGSGLVVGYASGSVALFDATTYVLQKLVRDMQNSAVTAAVFWGAAGRQNIVTTDELGRCYMLTFNTFLVTMTCEKKLLLKKEKPVKAMAALRRSEMAEAGLVAMVSSEAVTVVSMAPTPRLVFEMPLSESESLCVCWCTDPVMLCVGVGRTIHLLRPRTDLAEFDVVGQILLPSKDFTTGFRSLRCVGGGLLAAVVAPAQEPSSREVILVQTNRPRTTLLRGSGNVVYRHRLLGTYCPDLIAVNGPTVILPGYQAGADTHHFTEVTVGYWQDEIKRLLNGHHMKAAITIVSGIGSGGLPQLVDASRPNPMEMEALLRVYLSDLPEDDDLEAVQERVTLAVDACASMALWDFLYRVVFSRCEACGAAVRDVYLKVVETRLRSGVLPPGTVDSEVVAIVLSRFRDELAKHPTVEVRRAAEDFCLSVNPGSLDLNFTTRMATEFGLWSVLVYVYNVAFGDYATPLQIFVDAAVRAKKRLEQAEGDGVSEKLASMPLVEHLYGYLTFTLAGKAYPLETPTAMPKPPATAINDLLKAIFDDTAGCFGDLLEVSPAEFFKALPPTEECIQKCSVRMTERLDRGDDNEEIRRSYYLFIAKACQVQGIAIAPKKVRSQVLKIMLQTFPEKRVQVAFERIYEDDKCASIDVTEFVKEAAARGMRSVEAWALGHCLGEYEEMLCCYLDTPQLSEDIFDDVIRTEDPAIRQGVRAAALKLVKRLIELNPAETGRLFMDGVL